MTLVDTNVLFDIVTDDPVFYDWAQHNLDMAALDGPVLINPIVYAELGAFFESLEGLEAFLADVGIRLEPIPEAALFNAGKAHKLYRSRGGARERMLPDFLIGAHASQTGMPLLTRDRGRYESYFPTLTLITPNFEH